MWIQVGALTAFYSTSVLQIISGVILCVNVNTIHRYFKDRESTNYINSDMLMRHAWAFGLYLITTVTFMVCNIFTRYIPKVDGISYNLYVLAQFIS